ncbi:hypothetical protein B0H17DRAFT_1135347 [Mycena rosella]|uniref:BTB domain-containing protein n=1 Tax=Mycena rosella TaxID=1033263 RepID=A0AAD7DDK1_MYCRO|nr:hypothetical protein B0H17DRAFT_1135347 [Mycena rosella]
MNKPETTSDAPGNRQPGTNRSLHYFWDDGSMFIQPNNSQTLYCVWGSRLARYSGFFNDLASLPQAPKPSATAESKPPSAIDIVRTKAETSGGDGKTERTPLWIQPNEPQFEIFLECVFLELGQDMSSHQVEFWQTALEMADFFDSQIVRDQAILGMEALKDMSPILSLSLAMQYNIAHWIEPAFRIILCSPLPSLTSKDISMLGFSAYIILAEAHAEITSHRIFCALTVPPVVHSSSCDNTTSCNKAWAHAWWGRRSNTEWR